MLENYLLSVVTPAMSRLVVPRATVKSELGIASGDTTYDAKLDRVIASVSRAFGQELRRPPARQTYLERCNGGGGTLLALHRWPIESVTSVAYGGVENAETIDAAEYSVALEERSALYRPNGWACSPRVDPANGADLYDYGVTFVAGWLPPGSGPGLLQVWSATSARALKSWTKPAAAANGEVALLFECTTAGTTGGTEPTWPTTSGDTVTDGAAVWTARTAVELPEDIQEAAIYAAAEWFRSGLAGVPTGIQSERNEDQQVDYDFVAARGALNPLPPPARYVLGRYR